MTERTRLSEAFAELDGKLALMAARAEESLLKAQHALASQDVALAKEVKHADAQIDALQLEIEDLAAVAIATQQPVARDLRMLVAVFKVAADLERAADHAVHLAKATATFAGQPRMRSLERLSAMAETGARMIRATAEAFTRRSAELARQAAALDDFIDGEHKALTEEVLAMMREHPEEAEKAARLLKTSGYLERLGDHMTNACEDIVFMVEGVRAELNA
jgi:phosphate transport system protein